MRRRPARAEIHRTSPLAVFLGEATNRLNEGPDHITPSARSGPARLGSLDAKRSTQVRTPGLDATPNRGRWAARVRIPPQPRAIAMEESEPICPGSSRTGLAEAYRVASAALRLKSGQLPTLIE